MSSNTRWNADNIPDLAGQVIIITGANSGTGYESARVFAQKNAHTILACRRMERGQAAMDSILSESPRASLELMKLDLSDLGSVRHFAERFEQKHQMLNVLLNNAGVMALPYRTTADGFEMQFGTNHLGHFALTGLLLDLILQTEDARVVTVSSLYHRSGAINFDDLNGAQSYNKWNAYAQSKLANLLFAYQLQRKLAAAGANAISVGTHPGYSATNLQYAGPDMAGSGLQKLIMKLANTFFAQSAVKGALPLLYAAIDSSVRGGDYTGPIGFNEMRGYPAKVESSHASHDQATATKLWDISEELTGIRYTALNGSSN